MLLFVAPLPGIVLTISIIVSDVAMNTWIELREGWSLTNWMYLSQVAFLVLVLTTSRYALPRSIPSAVKQTSAIGR